MYDILELNKKLVSELRDIAKDLKIKRLQYLQNFKTIPHLRKLLAEFGGVFPFC